MEVITPPHLPGFPDPKPTYYRPNSSLQYPDPSNENSQ